MSLEVSGNYSLLLEILFVFGWINDSVYKFQIIKLTNKELEWLTKKWKKN